MEIDIIVTSSSRLEELKKTIESIDFKWAGKFRWILHEDIFNYKDSEPLIRFALKGFNVMGCHFPRLHMMRSLRWLLDQCKSKYVIHFHDDIPWVKQVDLNLIIKTMEEHSEINGVHFNIRPNLEKITWVGEEFTSQNATIGELKLSTLPYFHISNCVWRYDFIDKVITDDKITWREFMAIHKNSTQGSYFMGHIGEGHYTKHLECKISHRGITDNMPFGNYSYIERVQ